MNYYTVAIIYQIVDDILQLGIKMSSGSKRQALAIIRW